MAVGTASSGAGTGAPLLARPSRSGRRSSSDVAALISSSSSAIATRFLDERVAGLFLLVTAAGVDGVEVAVVVDADWLSGLRLRGRSVGIVLCGMPAARSGSSLLLWHSVLAWWVGFLWRALRGAYRRCIIGKLSQESRASRIFANRC